MKDHERTYIKETLNELDCDIRKFINTRLDQYDWHEYGLCVLDEICEKILATHKILDGLASVDRR